MPLAPVSTQAIDFADSTIFLKSSAEASVGLGAPFLIATAMPERASGVRAASLPCLIRSSAPRIGEDGDVDGRALLDLSLQLAPRCPR